jgi:hypothetical protein
VLHGLKHLWNGFVAHNMGVFGMYLERGWFFSLALFLGGRGKLSTAAKVAALHLAFETSL